MVTPCRNSVISKCISKLFQLLKISVCASLFQTNILLGNRENPLVTTAENQIDILSGFRVGFEPRGHRAHRGGRGEKGGKYHTLPIIEGGCPNEFWPLHAGQPYLVVSYLFVDRFQYGAGGLRSVHGLLGCGQPADEGLQGVVEVLRLLQGIIQLGLQV